MRWHPARDCLPVGRPCGSGWTWVDFPLLVPIFFLFPDGLLRSRRWAPVLALGMVLSLVATVWLATAPGPMLPSGGALNPLPWAWLSRRVAGHDKALLDLLLVTLAVGIGSMLLRARAVTGPSRRGIVLVALAGLLLAAEVGHEDYVTYAGAEYFGAAVSILFAVAIAVAVLRYRLYEIDLIVSRTVTYAGLTVVLGAAYVGSVALAQTAIHSRVLGSVPAAAVVALLFAPVRARLQAASDKLLFGEREDPYAVISTLSEGLDTSDPANVLPALADTIARTLKLSYVAIELQRREAPELVAEHGRVRGEPVVIPLAYSGQAVGRLSLGPRTPGEAFTPSEQRLFEDIARQTAVAAYAVALTEDLQRSREQLVTAREEERRRLRRDLHDGLGPTLAGISLQIASARLLLDRDTVAADGLLAQLVDETQAAIVDVRRLVYALRPPALDELGLVPALRMQAERFPGLEVVVEAPEEIESLPAAVQVAAYRIATEALTNVSRHAGAKRCTITVEVGGQLELEVRDDGAGMVDGWRPGVGVASIRERAAELEGPARSGTPPAEGPESSRACPSPRRVDAVRVLVADDHPLFRAGLVTALKLNQAVEVVGESATGAEAVAAAARLCPDVVVMDLHMPEVNGIEATRQILAARPQTGVLVLTMLEDDESVFSAMRAGARGYLLKGAGPEEISRALEAVGRGEAIFGPSIARQVIAFMSEPRPPEPFPELTPRERELLELIAQGWSNARIAEHFVLSTKTVRNHVSNILTKLSLPDRSRVIVHAREAGLGGS